MSDRQKTQVARVLDIGARLAIDQDKRHREACKAMEANLHRQEDDDFVELIFRRFFETATASEARRMAYHGDCPADLRERYLG